MLWNPWRRLGRAQATTRSRRYLPILEGLENRTTPTVFTNPTPIKLFDGEPSDPYPSSIDVAGLPGPLAQLTVTLHRVSAIAAADIDILLVSPQGQSLILIGDAGVGANDEVTVIFSDAGSVIGPNDSGWANGQANTTVTRVPINYPPSDFFPQPAPQPPYFDPDPATVGT